LPQAAIRLVNDRTRHTAAAWAWSSEPGTLVTFATPHKRTLSQNAAMWAALTEIAEQVSWHGQQLSPDDWKLLFLADMDRGQRMVPALDGRGWVNLNTSSSALTVSEFAALLDAIYRFAAENSVTFRAAPTVGSR
jgi:NinB protein